MGFRLPFSFKDMTYSRCHTGTWWKKSWTIQMTSKCGRTKKVTHEAMAEYATDVLSAFWRLLWSITEQTHDNMRGIYLLSIIKKHTTAEKAFLFQNLPTYTYCLYKRKQTHWLLCAANTCDWCREITPLSKLNQALLVVEWKTYSKGRIRLWNP